MRAVNLLPRDTKLKDRAVNLPAVVGAGVGVVVVAALAGGFMLENSKVASARRGLEQAKQELASTPLPPAGATKPLPTAPAVAATQQPLLQAVSSALGQRIAWDRILGEFSRVVPSDVWLNSLTLTTPTAGTTSSSGITLSGTTYSYDSVARLLARLSLVPDLNSVTLASTTRSGRLVQFSVNAGVNGAPAPAAATTTTTTATTTTTP